MKTPSNDIKQAFHKAGILCTPNAFQTRALSIRTNHIHSLIIQQSGKVVKFHTPQIVCLHPFGTWSISFVVINFSPGKLRDNFQLQTPYPPLWPRPALTFPILPNRHTNGTWNFAEIKQFPAPERGCNSWAEYLCHRNRLSTELFRCFRFGGSPQTYTLTQRGSKIFTTHVYFSRVGSVVLFRVASTTTTTTRTICSNWLSHSP